MDSHLYNEFISDDIIVYSVLAFLVILLIIVNCILCCFRPKKTSKYMENEISEVFKIDEMFRFLDTTTSTRYYDAPSRFLSSTTIESVV
ncbi:hypothetical protein GCK72_009314 [Caenorhabditis remanei]|uniref:Uncharacterized protein n=1 Tax=Caenorhabditis remanei TaxID=31234 RepID=A0A6A5GZX2_CAERE|nr:hypothetical protein GCK72_009314 [Caenorhabditis remanei]KAF1761060.1 hypothetical protein GCK72_009314 [Caenorhabditis remanei]